MKKIFISLLIPCILLIGCTQKPETVNDLPLAESLEKYTKDGVNLLESNFIDADNIAYAANMLGLEPLPIDMKTINGEYFNIKDYKGKKFVMFIERSGCPSCIESTSDIHEVFKDNTDIELISVFYSDEVEAINKFYDDLKIDQIGTVLTSKREDSLKFLEDYRLTNVPAIIFVDENFKISNIHIGSIDKKLLEDKMDIAFSQEKKLYEYKK